MANNQQLTLALRIRADLNDAQDALRRLNGNVDELGQSTRTAARDADQLNAATQRIGGGMTALAASIKAAALGLGALFSIREIIQTTDAWTNLQNRLRLVTSTQAQLAAVTADVYRIAQLTSSALDSTATVYQRFAQNADRLNISQRQVASLTDTVAKSIAISGASAQSAEAALVQFGQALASGVLRGEEFNSVSEQAPALLKAIADGLNVNIGELRKMANEGQLTADVLVDALSNAAAGVNDQFATSIKTVSMAVQELENAFTRLVGEFTNGRGAGEALAGAISGVANVMDGLSDNAELLGTALDAVMVTAAGRAVAAITGLTTTWLSNAAASRAAAIAAAQKATADEGAAVAAQRAAAQELQRAKAAVASAEAEVAASRARQAASIQNLRDVQAALVAERTLEQARLQAQITDIGRQQSLARLAELRLSEAAIIRQVQAAEAALASTTLASSAAVTAAYQRRTAAVAAAASAQQALTVATNNANIASAAAAAASSFLARGMGTVTAVGGRLLGFLGGPIGVISMIAIAATAFLDFGSDAESGMDRAANATESASVRIRNASRNIIQALNLGDLKTANYDQLGKSIEQIKQQLAEAEQIQQRAEALQDTDVPTVPGMDLPSLDEANERVQALTGALRRLEAERAGDRFKNVREGKQYLENLERQNERLQNLTATEEALNYLRKEGIDATSELGRKILDQAAANQKLDATNKAEAESKRQSEAAARKSAQTSEQLRKSQEGYVTQLERQAALLGMNSAEVRAYELAEKGLTGALRARAEAALAAIDADEKRRQADANASANADLQAEYLRATGRTVDAGLLEIRTKFDAMRRDFEKAGNDAGLAWIDKLIPVAEAKVRLDDVKQQMDDLLADQQRAESSVNVQQDAGVINEMDARQRILDIHRATYEKLQQIRPILEQMARQPGEVGRAAAESLAQLDAEAARLQQTTTLLETTLRDGLTTGFTDAIKGLASGTMDLRDAITSLGEAVLNALVNMAAQNLAQSLLQRHHGAVWWRPAGHQHDDRRGGCDRVGRRSIDSGRFAADRGRCYPSGRCVAGSRQWRPRAGRCCGWCGCGRSGSGRRQLVVLHRRHVWFRLRWAHQGARNRHQRQYPDSGIQRRVHDPCRRCTTARRPGISRTVQPLRHGRAGRLGKPCPSRNRRADRHSRPQPAGPRPCRREPARAVQELQYLGRQLDLPARRSGHGSDGGRHVGRQRRRTLPGLAEQEPPGRQADYLGVPWPPNSAPPSTTPTWSSAWSSSSPRARTWSQLGRPTRRFSTTPFPRRARPSPCAK
ncbi:tape measure protein [Pseudomonas aeruginosa]|nr:tape measure protein [Pseudomonas aeruginosa]